MSDAAAPGQTVGGKGLCLALFGVYLGKQPVSQVSLTRARRPRSGHVHTVAPRAVRFGSLVGPASAAQLERFEAAHLMRRSARLSWDVEMRRGTRGLPRRCPGGRPSPLTALRATCPPPRPAGSQGRLRGGLCCPRGVRRVAAAASAAAVSASAAICVARSKENLRWSKPLAHAYLGWPAWGLRRRPCLPCASRW